MHLDLDLDFDWDLDRDFDFEGDFDLERDFDLADAGDFEFEFDRDRDLLAFEATLPLRERICRSGLGDPDPLLRAPLSAIRRQQQQ